MRYFLVEREGGVVIKLFNSGEKGVWVVNIGRVNPKINL